MTQLFESVQFLASQLNEYLVRTNSLDDSIVSIAPFVEPSGGKPDSNKNKIMLSMVNLQKITTPILHEGRQDIWSQHKVSEKPLFFDVFILLAANFDDNNHHESLRLLSESIGYFQRKPHFNHQNSPSLSKAIEKLFLDVENLNFSELSSLWSILGRKYMPSILYKMRLITFFEGDTQFTQNPMLQPQGSANHG